MWESKWLEAMVALVAAAAISCQPIGPPGITQKEADRIVATYLEARQDAAHLDRLDQIYDSAVVVHDCSAPDVIRGLDALKSYYMGSHAGLPDFKISIDELLISMDRLILRWTVTGTHTGDLRGLPPTGNSLRFSGVAIDRVAGGRIVEEWVDFDVLDLVQQLGFTLVPPAPSAGK